MNPPREVGAPMLRRSYGQRIRVDVLIYCVDTDRGLWAYTLGDARQRPLARSVQPRRDVDGMGFAELCTQIETLTGAKVEQRSGTRGLIRSDAELAVAVRTVDSSGEIPFRSDVL